ncbi:MAG TPA: hypothetical protein VFI13_03545 [Gemmatimonadales bacterium]|nr:hypothetical protein [Gemmatimonadales bacterium]
MNPYRKPLAILFRLSGATLVVLGLILWTGHGANLTQLHMLVGVLFTVTYLAIVALASRSGLTLGPSLFALGWGFLLPILGMVQTRLLPGEYHWVIRVLHLLVGIAAMGIADRLVKHSAIIDARRAEGADREPMTV